MESDSPEHHLRALPPAHVILASDEARILERELSREAVRELVRGVLDELRDRILRGAHREDREVLIARARAALMEAARRERTPRLRRVINATGVVLHTNLGRAPLGEEVVARVADAARGYATLEYDLARGGRGHRDELVAPLLARVVGAEDALVVNNNAAAVLLAATALAAGREVVVSRGELVEIGGGFRIPDILAACGARLVEVGTTNRTRPEDYDRAVTERTAAMWKVHRSNFAVVGFVQEVSAVALAALGRARGVPVLEDLGSGALVDTAGFGLPREPTVRESLAGGVDLVMFSGDKLLGGPQAGLLVGRRELVTRLRRHPLARALRPGRLVLAALEATLRIYAEGRAREALPVVASLAATREELAARAGELATALRARGVAAVVVETAARVGGGALPAASMGSFGVRVEGVLATAFEAALRRAAVPVVARIVDGAVVLDVRTVATWELADAVRSVVEAAGAGVPDETFRGAETGDEDDGLQGEPE